jgi:alpha-L-fucosidase 2
MLQQNLSKQKAPIQIPFFAVAEIKEPLVSSKAKSNPVDLKKTIKYDFTKAPRKVYVLNGTKENGVVKNTS